LDARLRLEASGFAAIGPDLIRDALYRVGFAHRFDSAQLALNLVRWDGVPRVDSFLQTYYGAVAGEYAVAVGRYLWSALAGRTLDPGCQADMVPILVSAGQGHGKTSSVRVLALLPDAYVTLDLSARDADLARRMRGRQVYELGELQGLHTRAKEAIKVFITERADTWTPKYQEITVSYPRRGVFVGTTDHDEILDDEAGERRWLPVRVGRVDVAGVAAIRAQLWSEGAVLFAQHGVMWKEAERLARSAHADFKFQDSWLQDVAQVVQEWQGDTPVTLRDVAHGLGLDPRQVTRATEMRLAKILTTLGYGKRRSMVGGVVRKVFWEKQ
jgi:predicted P-loop ATPase